VADDTTRAIDRFFDAVDGGVDKVARVLTRTQNTEEQLREKYKRRTIIDAEVSSSKPKAKASARGRAGTTAVTTTARPRFRIMESVDPRSGNTIYVVTDGSSRTECASREFAQQILRSLEKTP